MTQKDGPERKRYGGSESGDSGCARAMEGTLATSHAGVGYYLTEASGSPTLSGVGVRGASPKHEEPHGPGGARVLFALIQFSAL